MIVKLTGVSRASHGARPVHPNIMMIKWIRTSRLSIQNSLSRTRLETEAARRDLADFARENHPSTPVGDSDPHHDQTFKPSTLDPKP